MQLAFEFPAVIVRPATGAVPLLVAVGVGEGDGLPGDEGDQVGPPLGEGLPFDDGVLVGEGLPPGDGLPPGEGLLPGGRLTVADAPRLAPSAAPLMLAPAAIVHGPLTCAVEAGLFVISSQSGVLFDE
jgi:hypothetical protein